MKTVILCGGKSTRMGVDSPPKALIKIGKKPILWHIMKYYSSYGFRDFIICLGYKGNYIRKYFKGSKEFNINFVDTGLETNTGGRIKKIEQYINEENFFATYGDGLSDLDLKRLYRFHLKHKKMATITAVKPRSQFGIMSIDPETELVEQFEEKPMLDYWVNGGFFVFSRGVFRYLREDDILEKETFSRLLAKNGICAFKRRGFWMCMDTYKDNQKLNEIWNEGKAPWKKW